MIETGFGPAQTTRVDRGALLEAGALFLRRAEHSTDGNLVAVTISDLAHTQLAFSIATQPQPGTNRRSRAWESAQGPWTQLRSCPPQDLGPGSGPVDTTMPRVTVSLYASEKSTERPTFAATRSASALLSESRTERS